MKAKLQEAKREIAGLLKNTFFRQTLELEFAVFLVLVFFICHLAVAATIQWAVVALR